MGLGSFISKIIQATGLTFPSYIGAMIAAAIIRNISDIKKVDIQEAEIEVIGNVSLTFFLCLALMGLKLWELFDLAGPLVVMLLAQDYLWDYMQIILHLILWEEIMMQPYLHLQIVDLEWEQLQMQ